MFQGNRMEDYIYKLTSYDNEGNTLLNVGVTNMHLVMDVLNVEMERISGKNKELSILHLTIEYIPVYNEEYE